MNKFLMFIINELPWAIFASIAAVIGLILSLTNWFTKRRSEKQNLYLSMKTLREKISENPRKCFESSSKTIYQKGLEIWVRNEVGAIDVPPQIELEKLPGWLTKEKKCFRSVIKCIKIHNGFKTWAEPEKPCLDGKHSIKNYDSNMAELLKLTAEWEEMN